MAQVTQDITPLRTYQPFEGISEAARIGSAVPRGIVRFEATPALVLKGINDDLIVNITGSLPLNFAHIVSSMSYGITVDRAADFNAKARFRIFDGIPGGSAGISQLFLLDFLFYSPDGSEGQAILDVGTNKLREMLPGPIWSRNAPSFTLQVNNQSNTAQGAGTMFFVIDFYQYDLTQAVRYPLNFPFPVGAR